MNNRALFVLSLCLATPAAAVDTSLPASALRNFGSQIADLVDEVLPSVVVIRTEAVRYHIARDFFFGQYYRIPERSAGQGSGVFISEDGYILTSHHVVDRAQQIEVTLDDGTTFPAQLVGSDPHTDLAVLKVDTDSDIRFPALAFGDSDQLRVGEVVIAIGSPFSLNSTVTMGIVSQKGRVIGMLPYEDFIQTQAPINPGNSGGPLVDADGRMVGINAAIHPGERRAGAGHIGISFAVPANLAARVAKALIEHGTITHPWIGVLMRPAAGGVMVEEVYRNSPAETAGMRRGDLITRIDGRLVSTAQDVRRAIFQHIGDDPIYVAVRRDDKIVRLEVRPEPIPSIPALSR
jgi:S1-C subfamily serine protease